MIAVLGSTGRVGVHIARALAASQVPSVAISRASGPGPLPVRIADLRHPHALAAALEGVTRLLLLTPGGPEQLHLERNALAAATAAGVEHIVKISGGAATLGPNGTTATSRAHWLSEQAIEQSGLGYTFLRPSFYAQNLLATVAPMARRTGIVTDPFGGAAIAMLDVRDLAACAVSALRAPREHASAHRVTGPRPVTLGDVARELGLRRIPVSPSQAARALRRQGASAFEIDHARRMAAYFASGADSGITGAVHDLSGHAARPVGVLLSEQRAAFRPTSAPARLFTRPTKEHR